MDSRRVYKMTYQDFELYKKAIDTVENWLDQRQEVLKLMPDGSSVKNDFKAKINTKLQELLDFVTDTFR